MNIYIAKYEDGMYPEDNKTIGVYWSRDLAEDAIAREIGYHSDPHYPNLNKSKRSYYDIDSQEIYLPDDVDNMIKALYEVAKCATYGQVIKSDAALDALGLNPYCVNEGRADSNEKVDISKIGNTLREWGII